jgi:hypothetical protein
MKLFFSVLFLFISLNCFGQKDKAVILIDCIDNDTNCTYNTLRDFIADKLNEQNLKQYSFGYGDIIISAHFNFNKLGIIVPKNSLLFIPNAETDSISEAILSQIPNIKPQLNKKGKPKAVVIRKTFSYLFDGNKLISKSDYVSNKDDYSITEKVPIYKGCKPKPELRNKRLRKCMSLKISKFIKQNFNRSIANKFNIPTGTTIKIFVSFKVDTEGNIFDVDAKSPYLLFVAEAIRVTKMISKLEAPGYIGSKAVVVPYSFPIVFTIGP